MNCLSAEKRTAVIAALVEGTSINATCRITGVAKHTALKLLKDLGCACAAYHDSQVRNLRVRRVLCDEIWAFVGAKAKNTTPEEVDQGWGDVWTWTALDADSKLIISYTLGDRSAPTAQAFMQDMASRISSRIQLTTDGYRVYAEATEAAFGADIDYAMLVKIYGASNDSPESRYSPATCIGCRTGILSGSPDPDHISTSYVERQNLSMHGDAPLHPADKRIQQKAGEPWAHGGAIFLPLQLYSDSSDASRDTRNGSRDYGSHVVF
jgi:IS1 family transposase